MIKLKDLLEQKEDSDDTAGILYSYFNNYLLCLTERSQVWNVPKGHIHVDETPLEGALREFTEETQIILNGTPEFVKAYDKPNGGKIHIFKLEGEKRFIPHLDHEHTDWGYFTKDKLPSPMQEFIADVLENHVD
tara:strand:+ start:169 stop:570 length:402 start_codon:yes stop_codon:yes gene_type:complete